MNTITKFFLRARHWQVFLVLFGMMVTAQIIVVGSILLAQKSLVAFLPFSVAMELFAICFAAWFWSMGIFLNSIVDSSLRLNLALFRVAVVYPPLYIPVFMTFFQSSNPTWLAIVVPLHLLAVFCMFYGLYFVSKSLVLAERAKHVSFSDYAGPFFQIWFFPIGIWFIQPKINRLFAGTLERQNA